jgi:hypothetical protein
VSHINIGKPIRAQIILWGAYRGFRVKQWKGALGQFFRFSVLLGPIEIRVWK